jgi:lysophospholipase
MKASENGFVPEPFYINQLLASLPAFHDLTYGDPRTVDQSSMPEFVTPATKFGKRVVYQIKEYDPLLDSCNMGNSDWVRIANDIKDNYDDYDAFIVLHGTDTMAYTASALSFMLENLKKTVIVTGSQIPLSVPLNDGEANLLGALTVAGTYCVPEVLLYFNAKAMRGNRCSKQDASALDAFGSQNFDPLITLGVDYKVQWNQLLRVTSRPFSIQSKLSENIGVFRLFPGFSVKMLKNLLQPPVEGLVLQTFGAGNAPDGNQELIDVLTEACERGVVIVNCTQCPKGNVEAHYATGVVLKRAGVVPGQDMTVEAALTKLAYLLGKGLPPVEVRAKMLLSLRGELTTSADGSRFSFQDNTFIESVFQAVTATQAAPDSDQQRLIVDAIMPVLMCSAAGQGMLSQLKEMVGQGADVNMHDYDKRHPLHLAAAEGHIDIATFLVENDADVSAVDRFGNTPLFDAISHGHVEMSAYLRGKGGTLMMTEAKQADLLINAANDGKIGMVELLLNAGVNANVSDYDKRTALHIAVAREDRAKDEDSDVQLKLVQLLLKHGASTELVDRFGTTAMSQRRASNAGADEILALLVAAKDGEEVPVVTTDGAVAGEEADAAVAVGSLTPTKAKLIESQSEPQLAST